jgi:hypothetical protein
MKSELMPTPKIYTITRRRELMRVTIDSPNDLKPTLKSRKKTRKYAFNLTIVVTPYL